LPQSFTHSNYPNLSLIQLSHRQKPYPTHSNLGDENAVESVRDFHQGKINDNNRLQAMITDNAGMINPAKDGLVSVRITAGSI
jgi:hypothetical protein